jgi:hypothetical protein
MSVFYNIEEIQKYEESEKFKRNMSLKWRKSRKIHELEKIGMNP